MLERGAIYLAHLYPSKGAEPGKTRPVLVVQSDMLNEIGHTTVIIVPLTTNLIDDAYPLRMRIKKREALEYDSDLLCDQIRAVDIRRLSGDRVARLTPEEMAGAEQCMQAILEFS